MGRKEVGRSLTRGTGGGEWGIFNGTNRRSGLARRSVAEQTWWLIWDAQYDTPNSIVKSPSRFRSMLRLAHGAHPRNHSCFVALPSRATVMIVIMLPQQRRAPKRSAITLVEDFKFHTRAVGGNGTWGGFGQGANWRDDTPPVCVPMRAFIQIADAGASTRLWSEALARCFPRP